jgi:predicted nucleic acid-binding protein
VKRYVAEPGSDVVRETMQRADGWFMCRVGYIESVRAVGLAAGGSVLRTLREEWASLGVLEVDQQLAEHAAQLTLDFALRSLDALHLAAALALPQEELLLATWDRRLHAAATSSGLSVVPEALH